MISSKNQTKDFQKNQILGENIKRFHLLKEKEEKEYDHEKKKRELEANYFKLLFCNFFLGERRKAKNDGSRI